MTITVEYILHMRETLLTFHEKVGVFIQGNGSVPAAGSQALTEQTGYRRSQSIFSAFTIGTQLIDYGGEHLTAFVKMVTEPIEAIACWTCVRSMLESCAVAAWLLDPGVDSHTRVGRVFALRYEGMEQQLKFCRTTNQAPAEIAGLETRIDDVERDAVELGFTRVVNRHNVRIGIAQIMPGATDMIKSMLDEEVMYRLLSAVAHGHHWAINQLSYMPATTRPNAMDKLTGPHITSLYLGSDGLSSDADSGLSCERAADVHTRSAKPAVAPPRTTHPQTISQRCDGFKFHQLPHVYFDASTTSRTRLVL